jgi:GMP synthase (glutamine-hydrolysing)
MPSLTIIKTGSTFPRIKQRAGDFEDWIIESSGLPTAAVDVVNVHEGEALPSVEKLAGVIITGSPAMVTDQDAWMRALTAWLPSVVGLNIPLLGICFGHQILAQAMGGQVDFHPQGREIGTVAISLTTEGKRDALFGDFPESFKAHVTHAQTVTVLPQNACRLAENPFETTHAFRLGENAWGVQFHPEFSAAIMASYIDEQAATLLGNGRDVAVLQAAIVETELANSLLRRFVGIIQK